MYGLLLCPALELSCQFVRVVSSLLVGLGICPVFEGSRAAWSTKASRPPYNRRAVFVAFARLIVGLPREKGLLGICFEKKLGS